MSDGRDGRGSFQRPDVAGAGAVATCPSCGRANRADARFCDRCSAELALICQRCGAPAPADANYCARCGKALRGGAPDRLEAGELPDHFGSGRYRVERLLGEGARKRVYLAHDLRLDRDVAIAQMKTEGLDEAGLARFRREARAMGRLGSHPHIVTVHDIVEDDGTTYIVTEYMEAGSLDDLLQGSSLNRLPVPDALRIFSEITSALEHAHRLGVIHRDVKPGNVWLKENHTASLGDFGLAHALGEERLSIEGLMVGTVAYMSPEQALGKAPDARSDLYSLGAMLYEMLSGRPPFLGPDPVAVVSQHINTTPIAPSWHNDAIPRPVEKLIHDLLQKDPAKRPNSATVVRQLLAAIATAAAAPEPAEIVTPPSAIEQMAGGVFVGRVPELDQLKGALTDVSSGQGQFVLIEGEPGIGKTRLVEELATYARLRGAQVMTARCHQDEGTPPYWPWVKMIRSYVYERDADTLASEMGSGAADIAQIVTDVRERLPGLPRADEGQPDLARFRLFDSVTTFLVKASHRQPLVLFIDDLQWGDESSLLLLQFMAREIDRSRLMVLVTYREEERRTAEPLDRAIAEIGRERGTLRIRLQGLSRSDIDRFIEASLGRRAPDQLVSHVHEQTDGNAFFVTELVRLVTTEAQGVEPADLANLKVSVPPSARDVIGRRLDQLSEDAHNLLRTAAIIGKEFDLAILQSVVEVPRSIVLDLLRECVAERILNELDSPGRYAFSHVLITDVLSQEFRPGTRLRLHGEIGEALEALAGSRIGEYLAELAHHFSSTNKMEHLLKALDYSQRAGDNAYSRLAFEEAARLYQQGVEIIRRARFRDEDTRCELLLRLGQAESKAGRTDDARRHMEEAAGIARGRRDAERLGRAALGVAPGFVMFGTGVADESLIALIEEALDLLPEEDSPLRARLLARLAVELYYRDEPERRYEVSGQAIEMAQRLEDPATIAYALNSRHHALWTPQGLGDRLWAATAIAEITEETGDKKMAILGHNWLIIDLLELGDIKGVESSMEIYEKLTQELREPSYMWLNPLYAAMLALLQGRFDEAEGLMGIALTMGQRARHQNALLAYGIQLTQLRTEQGRLAEIAEAIEGFVEQYTALPVWRAELAYMHLQLGQRSRAEEVFAQLAGDGFALPKDLAWLVAMSLLAMVCEELQDFVRARQLYDQLVPYANRSAVAGPGVLSLGSVSRYLGLLATTMGAWDDAHRHFDFAIAANQKMGARPWVAHAHHDYAKALMMEAADGNRERALALTRKALDLAHECGMQTLVEKVLSLKLEIQGYVSGGSRTSIDVVAAAVRRDAPKLRPSDDDSVTTLMFSDIEGSSTLTEQLGDRMWLEVLHEHDQLLRKKVAAHGGYVVRSQGDGFFVTFEDPVRAILSAIGIQRSFEHLNRNRPEFDLRLRIGLHTGSALPQGGDLYGINVNLAARIADEAKGGEIIVSAQTSELAQGRGIPFDAPRDVVLRGLSGSHSVMTIDWRRHPPDA